MLLSLKTISSALIVSIITFVPAWAAMKKVAVYEAFIEGAQGALQVACDLVPYLVGMIIAVGMLRDSGALDGVTYLIGDALDAWGFPKALLPLAILRPFSGAAANAVMIDIVYQNGPDSLVALMAATIMAATETTLYLAAVYFGSVGVTRMRHAVLSSLVGEVCGMIAAVWICSYWYG